MPAGPSNPAPLDYAVVDVFTARAFAGNPLAVVHGGDDLSSEQMHAIATEFNLSETTFPLSLTAEDVAAGADYRVRIFTPGGEVPFAGHPTLGTAWTLCQRGLISPGARVQSCAAGLIGVHLPDDAAEPVELTATPRDRARQLSAAEIAEIAPLVGLEVVDVVGPAFVAGCGLTWLYLHVSLDAVRRARPTGRRVSEVDLDLSGLLDPLDGIDVFAINADDGDRGPVGENGRDAIWLSSRVFVPGYGIPEDPATGSAAAGLGLALVAAGLAAPDADTTYRITQGVEMGRPSLLIGRVEARHGEATRVHVAGQVVPIATGTIRVP